MTTVKRANNRDLRQGYIVVQTEQTGVTSSALKGDQKMLENNFSLLSVWTLPESEGPTLDLTLAHSSELLTITAIPLSQWIFHYSLLDIDEITITSWMKAGWTA
ncbi:hypothetical protein GJ744_001156 [Endocarpon pusillum]|uniref:Uncharacterized protein n=1 Tax=Endocarpon pusillum TaxID=364733 RepID=A0A8H7E0U0_9EURO|nr:hypothetical protein GJ744_001156 [Endocarpon pusillum]